MPEGILNKFQELHSNLLKEGYDLPNFKTFQSDMQDGNKLKELHSNLLKEGYDLPEFNDFKSDMGIGAKLSTAKDIQTAFTIPQAKEETEKEANKSAAVNNTLNEWVKINKVDPNSLKAKTKKKEFEQGLDDNTYAFTFDANGGVALGRSIGGVKSYVKSLKESTDAYNEAESLISMSDDDTIKYLNKKASKPQEFMPEVPSGVAGYLGETFGGFARIAAKQGAGTLVAESIAGLLAPETGGASLAVIGFLAGLPGATDEIAKLNYSTQLQKYYAEGKKMNLSDKDAFEKAKTQARVGAATGGIEAVAYGLVGKAVGKLFPKEVVGGGVKKSIGKLLLNAAPEIIGTSTIAAGSSAAKDFAAQQSGYNIETKKILENSWDAALNNAKFMGTVLAVHGIQNGALKVTGYAKSQLKNYVTSMGEDLAEQSLKNLADQGVLKGEDVSKTIESLKRYKKAKKVVDPLNIKDEAVKGSIIGKHEKKMKLQEEINELEKNGIPVGIDERKAEMEKIDAEIKGMYETGDTDAYEPDQDVPVVPMDIVKEGEVAPTTATPAEWKDVNFKSTSGNDMYGKRVDVPGHEDMHIVIVDGEKGKEVWEETSGSFIGNVDPHTPTNEIPQRLSDKFDQMGLTSDKIYETIYKDETINKYGGRKFGNINETEGYKKYKEKKQAEVDGIPFVYQGEDRAKLEQLKKEAEANGEQDVVNHYDIHLGAREGSAYSKRSIEDIQKNVEFIRGKNKEKEIRENAREQNIPLPDEMKTPYGELGKNLGYKTPQIQKVKESVMNVIKEAHAKASAIVDKYGYFPNEYLDKINLSPELTLGRLIRSINAKDPAKRAARIAEAENEAYQIAKQIDEFAKKEGIDLGTSALDEYETELHKDVLSQTVKGTQYENQTGGVEPSGETATGAAGKIPTKSKGKVKPSEEGNYSHTDAGFKSDGDARDAYESSTIKDEGGTYEEFLHIKSCGDL